MKPVKIMGCGEEYTFVSFAECSRYLGGYYNIEPENIRSKLKAHRSHIFDFDIVYLNAETVHDSSKEQETVHNNVI